MKRLAYSIVLAAVISAAIYACGGSSSSSDDSVSGVDLRSTTLVNSTAYIPSQCYTVTQDENNDVHNPCYSCHKDSVHPNYVEDEDVQESYDFPAYALTNHWTNLFEDKSAAVAAISDDEILEYVKQDNYKDAEGNIILAKTLADVPEGWDYDGDGVWDGYVPDCYFSFDSEGFDRAPGGDYSGWRAFAYAPFLGTFWPTNGSTDDVLIRLGEVFRKNESGVFDIETYKLNLAILESVITMRDVEIPATDETVYGVDLDKDGSLGTAAVITYDWAPLEGKYMYFVGAAKQAQEDGDVHLASGLYPEGTEFLHSVRYIDVTGGEIGMAPRMKELRYAKKRQWFTYSALEMASYEEVKEKNDFPDRLTDFLGNVEKGVSNDEGWGYQAFIEDAEGNLRPQTFEETVFCMGCHGGVGATTDGIYSFSRKYTHDSYQRGWYHWSQKSIAGTPEHQVIYNNYGRQYEYSMYLRQNQSGDEFRGNTEVISKFFNADGSEKADMFDALHDDISVLLFPSASRALTLDKAYKVIVEAQSFIYGRDANVTPAVNVHRTIEVDGQTTGIMDVISAQEPRLIFE